MTDHDKLIEAICAERFPAWEIISEGSRQRVREMVEFWMPAVAEQIAQAIEQTPRPTAWTSALDFAASIARRFKETSDE
jgi:hypothetical protein